MAKYVDGYVLPVPKKKLAAYRRIARKAGKIWMEHGALEFMECVGDDLSVRVGVPFPRQIPLKARRDRDFLVDRVCIESAARPRQREGDEGQAPGGHGPEGDALRLQPHGLRGVQGPRRCLNRPAGAVSPPHGTGIKDVEAPVECIYG